MSDAGGKALTREFLSERDMRIFKMRQAGVSVAEIGRRFNLSTSVVNKAVQRTLEKMNREALLAYPEVLRMELERLDALQAAIWPMTQHRREIMDDGTEVTHEPDLKAIQQVLLIGDRRAKLLGMEQQSVNVKLDVQGEVGVKATLAGTEGLTPVSAFSPETEARKLLELMGISGVLPAATVKELIGNSEVDIVDAELVEISPSEQTVENENE
jgi:hypothetical protein